MQTDFKTVKVELEHGVAVLRMDNPPVNQMSQDFMTELDRAVRAALADAEIKALVLTGAGKNFVAGGDVAEMLPEKDKARFVERLMWVHRLFNVMEQGPKPVIAALNGNCLGGGLEMAMACHYRVAAPGISVGLPEVTLGLIPGSAGTQRLPRLIGLPEALDLMTTGRFIKAEKAWSLGLVDELAPADKLVEAALAAAAKFLNGHFTYKTRVASRRFDRLPSALEKADLLSFARAN